MAVEIFWGSGSPYGWRVILAAEFKQIDYVSHLLQFSTEDHKSDAFMELNPRGKVPALRNGDFVLTESVAMLVYLDALYPRQPLFAGDAEQQGRIWQVINWCISYFEPEAGKIIDPVNKGTVDTYTDRMKRAGQAIHAEFETLEEQLSRHPWLAGTNVTGADFVVYPFLEFLLRIAGREAAEPLDLGFPPIDDQYPNLNAWRRLMTTIEGYDRAYPPHWRETN